MKRIVAAVSVLCMLLMLTGCTGKCDICGKQGKINKVTYMGESAKLCDSCKALFDIGVNYMN